MKDRRKPLSAAFVRKVKTPGRYGDGGLGSNGLYLRVVRYKSNGRMGKSWGQRLMVNGKQTNLGLGGYPVVTLAEAREKALANRRAAYRGEDPRRSKVIPTFDVAAEKVIAIHAKGWKHPERQAKQWRQTLADYAFPKIGRKSVGAVTTSDVLAVLTPIWHAKPASAKVLRQRIGVVMKWAVAKGYREDNPAGDAIAAALPRKNGNGRHHKAIPHSKLADVLQRVRDADHLSAVSRLAYEFAALTACRSGEVMGARWSEVDLEAALWTIPAERMKAKREHRVPLSGAALDVLARARALSVGGDVVFASNRTGGLLGNGALGTVARKIGNAGTVHGLRTAFRSWAAETGEDRGDAEAALAHVVTGVEGCYLRSDLLERRRAVMERWAAYLSP